MENKENKEIKILIFCIDKEYYAINIIEIERILGYIKPTKIPDLPEFVEGVINYQDDILPIINLAKKFKVLCNQDIENAKIIASKNKDAKFGIIVDYVSEVKNINVDMIEKTPEIVSETAKRYIKGLVKSDDKIIIFLNLATILSEKEKQLL